MTENKSYDVFISYSSLDRMVVTQIVEGLRRLGLKTFFDELDIPAGHLIATRINQGLRSSRGVVFFFSPNSLDSGWVKEEIELALRLYTSRQIKFIIPVLLREVDDEEINGMMQTRKGIDFSSRDLHVEEVSDDLCKQLDAAIRSHFPNNGENVVDLPFVILAMNSKEARALLSGSISPVKPKKFADIKTKLKEVGYPPCRLLRFYGFRRDAWRSPLCQMKPGGRMTIKKFIEDVVTRLNDLAREESRGHIIDPQFRSEDFTEANLPARTKAHKELEDRCVLVVDSLSLFHPDLAEILNYSPLAHRSKNIIPIVVPPPYYRPAEPIEVLIEDAMREMMALSYDRFENDLDLLCEFGINHPRALRRWLFAALPEAAKKFSRPSPSDENRADFREGRWT